MIEAARSLEFRDDLGLRLTIGSNTRGDDVEGELRLKRTSLLDDRLEEGRCVAAVVETLFAFTHVFEFKSKRFFVFCFLFVWLRKRGGGKKRGRLCCNFFFCVFCFFIFVLFIIF